MQERPDGLIYQMSWLIRQRIKSLVKEEWLCRLSNADKNINICARVEVTYRKGILKNRTYKVVDGDGLAADHAAIILEGYHHVKEALNA